MMKKGPKKSATKNPSVVSKATNTTRQKSAVKPPSVAELLRRFESLATLKIREDMSKRYGIRTADKVFGVSMGALQKIAKEVGRSHPLSTALWETGCYEARMLASLIGEPSRVTASQMDAWCKDFDNWAVCDTVCFKLFDQTPRAFTKIHKWGKQKGEFQRRAAFALLASVALHQKGSNEEELMACLPLIEATSNDERNFVKKGVNWALRALGYVHSPAIRQAALTLAKKLAASEDATARWIGKDALKTFEKVVKKKAN